MPRIDLQPARLDQKPVLANLIQLYTHDFSEHWTGGPNGELGEDGLFEPYDYLDAYWTEPGRVPLLIRADGRIAGFVLVNDHGHGGRPVDRNVAEFFVVRKHRRGGVGTAAAHAVFSLYPGVWEAAVVRRNVSALAFWRGAVASHPQVSGIEERDVQGPDWDGAILRFSIAAP